MELSSFKEIMTGKTVAEKIDELVKTLEIKGGNRVARTEAAINWNHEEAAYWSREIQAMDDRAGWLYGEIMKEHGVWENTK